LIHPRLCFPSALQVPGHFVGVQRAQQRGVHRLQHGFFLLEFPQHRVGTDMQRSRRITYPARVETHVDDRLLHFGQAPAVAIVEQETALGTEGVLAEVTLGAPGRFATFDDLVTLTVRAADGDERHRPFLPKRDYEDEAQCDIDRSPSPLLKHYRALYSADNLQKFAETNLKWITRVPATLREAQQVLAQADPHNMAPLTEGYRYHVLPSRYGGIAQRWMVVYSEHRHVQAQHTIDKHLLKQGQQEIAAFQRLRRMTFACEADAQQAL